jgi:hypothetical protein
MTDHSPPELHRPIIAHRLGADPTTVVVTATPEECAAITQRLGIGGVESLECRFVLRRGDELPDYKRRGVIVCTGDLRASVVQDCVMTLEPFESPVVEKFRLLFVRAGTETEDLDPEADDEVAYEDDLIDLGEASVEQLALALDPYPRRPGAELPSDLGGEQLSPFAALARRARDS